MSIAELVTRFARVQDAWRVLRPELLPGGRQAVRGAVDHVHRAGLSVLTRDADHEVGKPVTIEVGCSHGLAKVVAYSALLPSLDCSAPRAVAGRP